jgi:hypothetical protein
MALDGPWPAPAGLAGLGSLSPSSAALGGIAGVVGLHGRGSEIYAAALGTGRALFARRSAHLYLRIEKGRRLLSLFLSVPRESKALTE